MWSVIGSVSQKTFRDLVNEEDNFKIILDVDGEISNSNINQSNYILMLENFFKKNCDFRIELFLGEKRDSNKLRL